MAIYQSATHSQRVVYYRPSLALSAPFNRGYIAVIVEFGPAGDGRVITAFHTLGPKRDEALIWP